MGTAAGAPPNKTSERVSDSSPAVNASDSFLGVVPRSYTLLRSVSVVMEEFDGPGPEFIAATSIAQLAPLLLDAANAAAELGDTPEHVAVAQETVRAFLERQAPELERSVATVTRVEDGVTIEYNDRTITIAVEDA